MVSQERGVVDAGRFTPSDIDVWGPAAAAGATTAYAGEDPLIAAFVRRRLYHDRVVGDLINRATAESGLSYPFGRGFHFFVPANNTQAQAAASVQGLFGAGFFDNQTRIVFVSAVLSQKSSTPVVANPATGRSRGVVDVGLIFKVELTPAGHAFPSYQMATLDTDLQSQADVYIIILATLAAIQLAQELIEILSTLCQRKFFSEYLLSYWNWVDLTFITSVALLSYLYYFNHPGTSTYYQPWDPRQPAEADSGGLAPTSCNTHYSSAVAGKAFRMNYMSYTLELAVVAATLIWRSLKYLQLSPALLVPFRAMEKSFRETLAFCLTFLIMNVGFAWIFHALYQGEQLQPGSAAYVQTSQVGTL